MNAINYLVDNVIKTVLDISEIERNTKISILLKLNRVSMFWFDTLNLSNGLIFLFLFSSMVKARVKSDTRVNSNAIGNEKREVNISGLRGHDTSHLY